MRYVKTNWEVINVIVGWMFARIPDIVENIACFPISIWHQIFKDISYRCFADMLHKDVSQEGISAFQEMFYKVLQEDVSLRLLLIS